MENNIIIPVRIDEGTRDKLDETKKELGLRSRSEAARLAFRFIVDSPELFTEYVRKFRRK